MKNFALKVAIVLALGLSIVVLAQTDTLINGMEGDNVRRILVDSSGRIITSTTSGGSGGHAACTQTVMNVGTTGTACPPTARSDRSSILVQLIQTGETMVISVDGSVATATNGVQISSGGTYEDSLLGTATTSCRCTAATCSARILECP